MATAGTKNQGIIVKIGTKAADPGTDTFTAISRCKMVGAFGPEAQVIDATALEDTVKQKLKGIPDNGDVELQGNRVLTDAGQNALEAAAQDNDDDGYNIQIVIPGAGAAGADVTFDFKALVTKFKNNSGQVDGLIEYEATLAITGAITES